MASDAPRAGHITTGIFSTDKVIKGCSRLDKCFSLVSIIMFQDWFQSSCLSEFQTYNRVLNENQTVVAERLLRSRLKSVSFISPEICHVLIEYLEAFIF